MNNSILQKIIQKFDIGLSANSQSVSILADIKKPPWGGANQFLLALSKQLSANKIKVVNNYVGPKTKNYILHARGFNKQLLMSKSFSRKNKTIIHRIDGPIHIVRGLDSHKIKDDECFEINNKYATTTVLQSKWSADQIKACGYDPINPLIIPNAVDPLIFNTDRRIKFDPERKIKLISTSWSDNPKKGGSFYKWIDENLNPDLYEYTHVGNLSEQIEHFEHIPPTGSTKLASILKNHDIYITASKDDPSSNALLEALACGLPALYLNSGGNPEIVKNAGLPFESKEEFIYNLEILKNKYAFYQNQINIPSIEFITDKWLSLLS